MRSVFFFGACAPEGFVSHADSLLGELKTLTIIKGGSGCGKSTFMRAIGRAAEEKGLDVQYLLCSSDPDSLDGVVLPSLSVGFADGTSPHVLEPRLCGGSMNYLNFGEFYDSAAMRPNEERILAAQRENRACYVPVTACLAAADRLLDCARQQADQPSCREEVAAIAECLALSALRPVGDTPVLRRRFLSCVTPRGLWICGETPAALCARVYVLRDSYGLAPAALELLQQKAAALGHECYVCYSPLLPKGQPSHLLIPTAKTAFVTENADFPYDGPCFCRIDLDSTLPPRVRRDLRFCTETVSALLLEAVRHLREAKRHHDRIEQLCRPFVDFPAVTALTERTIAALL